MFSPTRWITSVWLPLILLSYAALSIAYATQTPAWQAPDEPAHYNYIRQLAENDPFPNFPKMEMGDWDADYQSLLTREAFHPRYLDELDRVQFQDHQPPLYYLLATPIYRLSEGDLTALRLFSALLGSGVILSAFAILRLLFPSEPWLALTAAAFVAFIPQHISMMSAVNNDALANPLVGLNLLAVVWYLHQSKLNRLSPLLLGLAVGLALLTKTTIYFLGGIAGLALVLRARREGWSLRITTEQIVLWLLPILILGGLWWGRNLSTYGGTDFLGLAQHNIVAADQLGPDEYIEVHLGGDAAQYRRNFLYTSFHSFWGQFGWMASPMSTRIYRLILLASAGILIGIVLYMLRHKWPMRLSPPQRESLALFALSALFVLAAYLLYNRSFVQFQGRYLFPALIPLSLGAALGVTGWLELLTRYRSAARWLGVALMFGLALLAALALDWYIVAVLPNWN